MARSPRPRLVELNGDVANAVAGEFELGTVAALSLAARGWVSLNVIWRLETDTGVWAIKEITRESVEQLEAAAAIELGAAEAGVAVPHLRRTVSGAVAGEVAGRLFRCHEFVVGERPTDELQANDAEAAGAALGQVHRAGLPWDPVLFTRTVFGEEHWLDLIRRGGEAKAPWVDDLRRALPRVVEAEAEAREWFGLDRRWIGSHRDVRPDNALRLGDRLLLVDWDGAGPVVPGREVAGARRWWRPHQDAFVRAYVEVVGDVDLDEGAGEDGALGWWLETNVQHALQLPDDEERAWAVTALAANFLPGAPV